MERRGLPAEHQRNTEADRGRSEGSAVDATTFNTLCGISVSPADKNYGIHMSNRLIRTHAVDMVRAAREELVYTAGDAVDREVFAQLTSNSNAATSNLRFFSLLIELIFFFNNFLFF